MKETFVKRITISTTNNRSFVPDDPYIRGKIVAIKALRSLTSMGLKDAKDHIEASEVTPTTFDVAFAVETGTETFVFNDFVNNMAAAGYTVTSGPSSRDVMVNHLKSAALCSLNDNNFPLTIRILNLVLDL